jgi:hypothetical protein
LLCKGTILRGIYLISSKQRGFTHKFWNTPHIWHTWMVISSVASNIFIRKQVFIFYTNAVDILLHTRSSEKTYNAYSPSDTSMHMESNRNYVYNSVVYFWMWFPLVYIPATRKPHFFLI